MRERDPILLVWVRASPGEALLCGKWGAIVSTQSLTFFQCLPVPWLKLRVTWGGRAGGGGPDLGWGLGPLYYRELGSSLNSVQNGRQGDSRGHSQGDRERRPGQPTPTCPSSD